MTLTHFFMLLAIVVSAVIVLLVGHLQRKQMRQVELFKMDPSVGLVPPPSALTRFVKSNWDIALGVGGPIVNLAMLLTSTAPLNRLSVLLISISVALLITNIFMAIVFRLVNHMMSLIGNLGGIVRDHFEITKASNEILKMVAGHHSAGAEPQAQIDSSIQGLRP